MISLEKLGEQVHLSREVCCRRFRKMTGKTVTQYLEEYRVSKSLPLVESGFLRSEERVRKEIGRAHV